MSKTPSISILAFSWVLIIGGIIMFFGLRGCGEGQSTTLSAKQQKEVKKAKKKVAKLIKNTNAIETWENRLVRGKSNYRVSTILTIELQRAWIKNGPILFIGSIKDIAFAGNGNCVITLRRSMMTDVNYPLSHPLQLEVHWDKKSTEKFLDKHPNLIRDTFLDKTVAVAADIEKIKTVRLSDAEVTDKIKVGTGKCVDMVYIGSVPLDTEVTGSDD